MPLLEVHNGSLWCVACKIELNVLNLSQGRLLDALRKHADSNVHILNLLVRAATYLVHTSRERPSAFLLP